MCQLFAWLATILDIFGQIWTTFENCIFGSNYYFQHAYAISACFLYRSGLAHFSEFEFGSGKNPGFGSGSGQGSGTLCSRVIFQGLSSGSVRVKNAGLAFGLGPNPTSSFGQPGTILDSF